MTEEKPKRKRGGGIKKAPPGYYMPREAREKLGMTESSFNYYVRQGKIRKYTPPLRSEGFYDKKEIDKLALEMATFLHLGGEEEKSEEKEKSMTRVALPEDAEGIVNLFKALGWQASDPSRRQAWYKENPLIDFVVVWQDQVMGYISAMPLDAEMMEEMVSGSKRGWDIKKGDILPYEQGQSYDVFVGIVVRIDIPGHSRLFTAPLVNGFFDFLCDLAKQNIFIRRLYAHSAEAAGQRIAAGVGFQRVEGKEGDLFPRYMLDLETSDSRFAQLYRQAVQSMKS